MFPLLSGSSTCWSPMAAVSRLSNSMGSRTQLSTEKRCTFTGPPWLPSTGSATLWGHAPSCQQRNVVYSLVPHGCCQEAQQGYGVTHTAVNRETLYIHWSPMAAVNRLSNSMWSRAQLSTEKSCIFTVSHGHRQQAQQLYGVMHTGVNRETLYIHWSPKAAISNSMGSRVTHTAVNREKLYIYRSPMAAVNRLSNSQHI